MSSDVGTPYADEQLDAATGPPVCPACGRAAQPDASFCPFCGTGLVHQRMPGYPVFAAVAAAITGRTAYDVLSRVGEVFEGHGAVFEGVSEAPGTLVSLFPPTEDAATVAARAALEAQAAAPEVRLGLDAAEVTERSDQDAIWEFLIDGAVRLQAMAQDGEVVAGEAVLPLTEGAAVVSPIDPAGGPVLVGAVRDLTPQPARGITPEPHPTEAIPTGPQDAPPFAGRTAELAEIRERFACVLDGRTTTCMAVVGEPGVGKTTLLRRSAEELSDVASVWIRPEAESAWPLAALITAIAGVRDDGEGIGDALELIAGAEPDGDRIVKRLAHALGLPGGEPAADETRWAVRRLLECVSSEPLVIWADDVDRVAPGFAAFLAEVVAGVRGRPILVVCAALSSPPGITQVLRLEPLEEGEGEDIRDADADDGPEPSPMVIPEDDGPSDAAGEPPGEPEALIASAAHAEALGDPAGAAGFEHRAAASLPKDDPLRAELLFRAAMHEADAGLAREAESTIAVATAAAGTSGGTIEWQLRVLRASLRANVDPDSVDAARAVADEAYDRFLELQDDWGLARALELRASVHAARGHAAAVVEDLTEAAAHARAAGRPTEHAIALRGVAAALLNGPVAVDDAIGACERLREEAVGSRTLEQDLNGTLAVLLARGGRIDEARTIAAEAVASMEELGARAELAIALQRRGIVEWLAGATDAAASALQSAYAAAAEASDERLRAAIAATWATLLVTAGRQDPDTPEAAEALELAEVARTWAADPATNVGWRVARARSLTLQGRADEADRLAREAVSVAEQTDSVDLRANALLHLAYTLARSGRPDEAAPFERRAQRLITRAGTSVVAAVRAPSEAPTPGPADAAEEG